MKMVKFSSCCCVSMLFLVAVAIINVNAAPVIDDNAEEEMNGNNANDAVNPSEEENLESNLSASDSSSSSRSNSGSESIENDGSSSSSNDGNVDVDEANEGEEGGTKEERVDLMIQKNHHGDIMQLWDESELDGNMRNALRSNSNNRWTTLRDTDGKYFIPYVISGQFSSAERQIIQKGMDAIDRNSCIRFKPRKSEPDYVDIQNQKDQGCYTTVGRIRGRQVLMLETGWKKSCGRGCLMTFPGCVDHGTVVHELLHKVGLWHEQMRSDRDKYIKVHYGNITQGFQSQFDKVNAWQSTTFNLPYDYMSVMHYGKSSGARQQGLVTMETLDKRYQDKIGTAKDASTQDYRKICSIYQCSRCMNQAFTPLRSIKDVIVEQEPEQPTKGTMDNGKCEPLSDDCDQGIQPGHSLYNLYCCPKCDECEPKQFCSVIEPERQKSLYETFCCGRCKK